MEGIGAHAHEVLFAFAVRWVFLCVLIFLTDLADLTAACEPCLLCISSELGSCLVSCGCPGLRAASPEAAHTT